MDSRDFIKFIEDLSIIKEVEDKTAMIKNELKKLDRMIKESNAQEYTSRMDKLEKQSEYLELISYKNTLSFRLSTLESNIKSN
jgi:DNA polymerase II small subunit/DNA polymerase delta subunit B